VTVDDVDGSTVQTTNTSVHVVDVIDTTVATTPSAFEGNGTGDVV